MSRQSPSRTRRANRRIMAVQSYCLGGTCGHHRAIHVDGLGCTGTALTGGKCECRFFLARTIKVPEAGGVG